MPLSFCWNCSPRRSPHACSRARADLARLLGDKLTSAGLDLSEISELRHAAPVAAVMRRPARALARRARGTEGTARRCAGAGDRWLPQGVRVDIRRSGEGREDKKGDFYVARRREARPPDDGRRRRDRARHRPQLPLAEIHALGSGKPRAGCGRFIRSSDLRPEDRSRIVDFDIDGLTGGKDTRGHRFMAPEAFTVKSFKDYAKKLRKAFVIVDGEERRKAIIASRPRTLAGKQGLELIEDEALLAENAGLTEWPVVLMGAFDEAFLDRAAGGAAPRR